MQIILISALTGKNAGRVSLSPRTCVGTAIAAMMAVCFSTVGALADAALRRHPHPRTAQLILAASEVETERDRTLSCTEPQRDGGQAGRDAGAAHAPGRLGERLSSLAGFRPQEFRFSEAPGLGGAAPALMPPQNLSLAEFSDKLSVLARNVESRADMLGVLDAQLFEQAVKKRMLPTMLPVKAPYNASGFGRRVDPFTGQWAMHEGIDFLADAGSPIAAAAAGVVVFAGFHPQYGYMVDIDHGNDLVTRYAHQSRLYVKEGDVVQRGHKIGEVGSTGRSTGPHLHFEVRTAARRRTLPSSWCRTQRPRRRGPSSSPGFRIKSTVFAAPGGT